MQYERKTFEIQIKGLEDVIWNVPHQDLEDERKKLKKNDLDPWEQLNWIRKAEYNTNGEPVFPKRWIKGVLITAAKKSRLVPGFAVSKNETFTYYINSLKIESVQTTFTKDDLRLHSQRVGAQGANSKTKVRRYWPKKELPWEATITITDVMGRMEKEELEYLFSFGGLSCGIGDLRNYDFGRFEVMSVAIL